MADLSSDAAQRLAETQDAITETQYVDDDEVEASVKRSFEQLRDAFALFDADGDGKLTEDEVVAALTRKTGQGTEVSEQLARRRGSAGWWSSTSTWTAKSASGS